MKVEIKLNETETETKLVNNETTTALSPGCDVAIDIGQILAANQALLKNMARKMETLEAKLNGMEKAYAEQTLLLQIERNRNLALLEAPRQEFKPWQPSQPSLDESYFNKFSVVDRVFRPWLMRRNSEN
jgi:Skp family chaperone for outer membrane proteins